jgi:hypothetical protein
VNKWTERIGKWAVWIPSLAIAIVFIWLRYDQGGYARVTSSLATMAAVGFGVLLVAFIIHHAAKWMIAKWKR